MWRDITELTDETWAILNEVNLDVNDNITYKSDIDNFGLLEHWAIIKGHDWGDCDDYAITKLNALIKEPLINALSLRLTIGTAETGRGHLVLLVQTNKGDYILDNRTEFILSWTDSFFKEYRWISKHIPGTKDWETVKGVNHDTD